MKTYRVEDIICNFGIFLDDEIEADNYSEAVEEVMNEIIDNIGNYIEIQLEEIKDSDKE